MDRTFPTMSAAFPDYPVATLPARLPVNLTDLSWRNDACPCFVVEATGAVLWADFADLTLCEFPEERESGALKRYSLRQMAKPTDPAHGWQHTPTVEGDPMIAESDDFDGVILPAMVGEVFAHLVRESFPSWTMWDIRQRNRDTYAETGPCATHDFCDANVLMAEAFEVLGVPLWDAAGEHMPDEAVDLWNAAWNHARRVHLTAAPGEKADKRGAHYVIPAPSYASA